MPTESRPSIPPLSARAVALSVLVESVKSDEGVDLLLDRQLAPHPFDPRERGLALELTYGVLRRQGTVDWRLTPILDKPLFRLPVLVQMILRLGAYQILFLDRIPESAAVNESVQLVKRHGNILGRDWSALVNAVLRQLIRQPAPDWPDMNLNPAESLSVRYSVPEWLSRRWVERFGVTTAASVCEQSSGIPPLTIRVNRCKMNRDSYINQLREAGIAAAPTTISTMGIRVEGSGAVQTMPGYEKGLFYVEDEAAQLIPPLLDPQPGDRILDACAAPGGKATHLAELVGEKGLILALDRKESRLDLLRSNCQRLGLKNVRPIVGDARQTSWRRAIESEALSVDRVLVDAPCSGLGVLRRHPDAKWRKDSLSFDRHQRLQRQILESVATCLRPGGVLVYSTCSTESEENEAVVEKFLSAHAEFRRESVAPWLPAAAHKLVSQLGDFSTMGNPASMDYFYAVRLTKASS